MRCFCNNESRKKVYMFNPYQNDLIRQKALIEQQLQQLSQVPPININNQFSQMPKEQSFDFNGRWVSNESEARQAANNNLPLILFDRESPIFYMKSTDGSLKKYAFKEVESKQDNSELENRVDSLDQKLDKLLKALGEGDKNEPTIQTNDKQPDSKHIRKL
nr:MAG TPA: hypothetical protein [Caudoviricetes sp.]